MVSEWASRRSISRRFSIDEGFPVIDHFIYCICSDGDLMEGVSYESASLAGHLKLDNLIYLYDDNQVTIDGPTSLAFSEDVTKRFEAAGWEVSVVEDGNDLAAIEYAIAEAQNSTGQAKAHSRQNDHRLWHAEAGNAQGPLGRSRRGSRRRNQTKSRLAARTSSFTFQRSARTFSQGGERRCGARKGLERAGKSVRKRISRSRQNIKRNPQRTSCLPAGKQSLPKFDDVEAKATRAYSGEVINAIADTIPQLIGGSGDLTPSNNTYIKSSLELSSRGVTRTATSISAFASTPWARR